MIKLNLTKNQIKKLKILCRKANSKWVIDFTNDSAHLGIIDWAKNQKEFDNFNRKLIHWFEFVTGILAQKLINPNNKNTPSIKEDFQTFLLQTNSYIWMQQDPGIRDSFTQHPIDYLYLYYYEIKKSSSTHC